jgi:hypothetical protein
MRRGVSVVGLPAIAVIWTVFLMPDCASACSCGVPAGSSPRELVRQELSSSDAVFAGEVVDIDKPLLVTSSVDPVTVTFRVSGVWKGAERETLDVETAVSDASCGYPFDEGESYLVFAYEAETRNVGGLEVALCGSTTPVSEAGAAFAALGPGAVPAGPPSGEGWLPDTSGGRSVASGTARASLLASGAVTLVAATVLLVGARKHRR